MNPDSVVQNVVEHFQGKYLMWVVGDPIQCMCMSCLCHICYKIIARLDGYE